MGYGGAQALNPKSKIPTSEQVGQGGDDLYRCSFPIRRLHAHPLFRSDGQVLLAKPSQERGAERVRNPLIEKDRPTVASHLRQAGYHTAVIGKWHLGLGFQKDAQGQWDWSQPLDHSPVDLGFDRSLIIPASLDFPPTPISRVARLRVCPYSAQAGLPGYLREGELGSDFSIIDCLDRLTHESCDHIAKRAKEKKPFFLYFPLTAPHKPVSPHPRFEGKSKLGPYGDFVMQVDWTVGQVIKAVDDAGIKDNTLVIYTSDNASFMYRESDKDKPHHLSDETEQRYFEGDHTANGPWRGTKAGVWEGGHRVPPLPDGPRGSRRAAFPRRRFAWSICSQLHPNWPRPRFRSRTKRLPTASVGFLCSGASRASSGGLP